MIPLTSFSCSSGALNRANTYIIPNLPILNIHYLHHVINLFLFFCARLVEPYLLFQIEQLAADHELLAADSLVKLVVVYIYQPELHSLLFLAVVVVELHLGEQQLSVIIVFNLKVSPFRHEADYFGRIRPCFEA